MKTTTPTVARALGDGSPRPLAASLGLGAEDVRALVRFAQRDARRGRVQEAIEALRVAAILDPRELTVWAALGECHEAAGNAAEGASARRVARTIERWSKDATELSDEERSGR